MFLIADAIRLTLFPAMMAFAASSDLLTMTISNRVSLILLGGFFALAAIAGISAMDMLSHLSAGWRRPRRSGSALIIFCPFSCWHRCSAER
jgi:Flp pilus assembly protein protease CpaA